MEEQERKRSLDNHNEKIGHLFALAEGKKQEVDDLALYISRNLSLCSTYKELLSCTERLLKKWGATTCCKLLAAVSMVPGVGTALALVCEKQDVTTTLTASRPMQERLFEAIQNVSVDYFIDVCKGRFTHSSVEQIMKQLAFALRVFGYPIMPNGLVTLLRVLAIQGLEGIPLQWYENDDVFDREDFEDYCELLEDEEEDAFWAGLPIKEWLGL